MSGRGGGHGRHGGGGHGLGAGGAVTALIGGVIRLAGLLFLVDLASNIVVGR